MKEMKLNAVKNLMQSLEFNREDKEALLHILQQELGLEKNVPQPAHKNASSQEYGPSLPMEILLEDGTISRYQDKGKKTIGVVIRSGGRKFALYSAQHYCHYTAPLSEAITYAGNLPKINGKNWRVLTTRDCYAIKDHFRSVNQTLAMIGGKQIVESNHIGVLVSDDSMHGATGWQVWFALDL